MTMNPSQKADQVKILLVDDLKDNLLALEALLKRDDIEIFKAKSGTDALELLVPHEFALALIDVQMPGMSGFELAELIRGTNQTKTVPIIFVSATAKDLSFSFKGYESGAVDFLLKPLDSHAVKSKVNIFIELYRQKMELKNQLETITRNQKEQEELLAKLKKTQGELEQAVRNRDEFLSIASHELKTPITSLKMQLQLAERGLKKGENPSLEKQKKMLDLSLRQVNRLTSLVEDLLDVSRIQSGCMSFNLEETNLSELIHETVERFSDQLTSSQCKLDLSIEPQVKGKLDRGRIDQVLVNLISNALKYAAGKPIHIELKNLRTGTAQIFVRDEGSGIPKEHQARIFEKFERAISSRNISGLGLGLFITRQIVEGHHGTISVQSEVGQGTSFAVILPLEYSDLQQSNP